MRKLAGIGIVLAALAAGGCAPMVTQSPGQGLSPVNAVSDGEDKHLQPADRHGPNLPQR